jgi:tetratricopeptide (TPR) repeat protein
LWLMLLGTPCFASAPAAGPSQYAAIETLIRQAKLDQAEQQLTALLKQNPKDGRAELLLGNVRLQQKNYGEAEKQFRQATEHSPKSLPACEALGRLLLDEARIDEATKQYEGCAKLSPTNAKNLATLAKLYTLQGKFEKSLAMMKPVAEAALPVQVYPTIAADDVALGRQDEAQAAIAEVMRHAPENPDLVPELANMFMEHGMASDAAELLRIAGPHQKNTAYFLSALTKAQAATGNPTKAKATLAKALQQDSKSVEALYAGAQIAIATQDWDTAAQYLDAALDAGPPRRDILQSAVLVELKRNNLQAAHGIAQRWYELQPDEPASALAFAVVLVEGNHYGEAKRLLEKVLQRNPDDKRALLAMGVVQYNAGQLADATRLLQGSLGKGPDDANAHYFLGLIAKQEGNVAEAISQMEQSLAVDPNNAKSLGAAGQLYLQENDLPKARAALEKAVEKAPDEPQNHYELARVYKKLSMPAEAQAQLALYEMLRPQRPQAPAGEPMRDNEAGKPN